MEGGIFHFSGDARGLDVFGFFKNKNASIVNSVTWADFAEAIFVKYGRNTTVIRVSSSEYPTKAKRPEWSILL